MLASLGGASGTLEEQDRQIERSGLYGEYPAIVRAYAELFADPESALEAVKRAVFLVWRGAMAPPAITGIAALSDSSSRAIIEELDARVRRGDTDRELAWMLAWYQLEGRFVFELYGGTPRLLTFAAQLPAETWRSAGITPASMSQRGQLGRYWAALAAGTP